MPWPGGADYLQAVQTPAVTFRDSELKNGQTELDKHGMPKPRSGTFAVAFKLHCGSRDYAVRCFLKDAVDRRERYHFISSFLGKANLPYTVTFDYQPEGILALGKWRPMLKMEWVQGDTLGDYVRKNVNNPRNLLALAGRWVEMTQALNTAGMAHGDLQHGNVMVMPSGQIKLIDYDGMYVPALSGRPSSEDGHRNYQHPLRSALDFGPNLDHFSEWVIYAALVMLSLDPTLWTKLDGGDECLIFRKADFDPSNSPALDLLERSKNEQIRSLAEAFRTLLYFGVSQVPLIDSSSLPAETAVSGASTSGIVIPPSSDWVRDHTGLSALGSDGTPRVPATETPAPVAPADASWVLAMAGPAPTPARFTNTTTLEWLMLVASATAAVFVLHYLTPLAPYAFAAFLAMNVVILFVRYRQQEIVRLAAHSATQIREQHKRVGVVQAEIRRLERDKSDAARLLQERLAVVASERSKIKSAEDRENERPRAQLKLTLSAINEQRKKLADSDSSELRKLQVGLGAQLMTAQRQLANVDQAQIKELADALEIARKTHVQRLMESAWLAQASISGIGPGRVGNLRAAGITNAADMKRRGLYGIPGIGPTLQGSLLRWAAYVESTAMASRPMALSPDAERSIRANYTTQRATHTATRDDLQKRMAAEQHRIAALHQQERAVLDEQVRQAHVTAGTELLAIRGQYAPRYRANDDETRKARSDTAIQVTRLDQKVATLAQQAAGLRWQLARLRHEDAVFKGITFHAYLGRAISPFAG